jgi:hypothetical protein
MVGVLIGRQVCPASVIAGISMLIGRYAFTNRSKHETALKPSSAVGAL